MLEHIREGATRRPAKSARPARVAPMAYGGRPAASLRAAPSGRTQPRATAWLNMIGNCSRSQQIGPIRINAEWFQQVSRPPRSTTPAPLRGLMFLNRLAPAEAGTVSGHLRTRDSDRIHHPSSTVHRAASSRRARSSPARQGAHARGGPASGEDRLDVRFRKWPRHREARHRTRRVRLSSRGAKR